MRTFIETKLFTRLADEYLGDDGHFLRTKHEEIWLLTLYAKNVSDNISSADLKKIKATIDG